MERVNSRGYRKRNGGHRGESGRRGASENSKEYSKEYSKGGDEAWGRSNMRGMSAGDEEKSRSGTGTVRGEKRPGEEGAVYEKKGKREAGVDFGKNGTNRGGIGRSESVRHRTDREKSGWGRTDKSGTDRSKKWREGKYHTPSKENGKGMGRCPVMRQCGGCQLLDMKYEDQLKMKQKRLEDLLKGICPLKGIIGMENPLHYRNKVHAVFDRDGRGNIISGIYQESSHVVVPVEKCLIEDEKADEIIGTIRGMLKSFKIRTYDEDTGYGLLRHVVIRRAFATGEIMVILVTASPVFPSKKNFVNALLKRHPEITTIVQNINGRGTSIVLGDKEHVLYGKGYITDELCECKFRISSKSFYQVNSVQTEVLYGKAMELARFTGKELVVDAYCGIGTMGIIASRKTGQVIGVELNKDAVRDAVNNAKMNEIGNIQFYCNDAGRFLMDMAERGENVDVVIMDPPRSGSTVEFMDSVGKLGVGKVVYVSCNPETLVRDLRYMKRLGYEAVEGWGVDMFAGTRHVESIIMMRNCGSKAK